MSLVPVEEQEEGTWIYLDGNHPNKQDAFASEEVWARREAARMRQIAIGKARPEYRRYVAEEGWDGRRERGGVEGGNGRETDQPLRSP
ncbi:unnamed protein product [Durusdinium trenchii]|uniref:Uncharacterized protein n=1 Tax=Durusdinium trenchii TaxID=1381693 RepID=A0ABP0JPA8_9DINO